MFAKPNEIGSVESLTTEIENVAGSQRLIIRLPFEARRFEFSLPAGEDSLDGSNEAEVPVLRKCVDEFEGREVNVRSLPNVIKEVCIARFGGVRTRTEWFSARATIEPVPTAIVPTDTYPDPVPAGEPVGSTDAEVFNAIEEFEASEATAMTDGGRMSLPRFCPNDDERLEPRSEEPLEVECPKCGYEPPRNLRGETVKICHKNASISENSRGEGEAYMAEIELGGVVQKVALSRPFVREEVSEPEVMTDGGSEEPAPVIKPTEFEEGEPVVLRYTSISSDTEQERRGEVIETRVSDNYSWSSNWVRIEGDDGRFYKVDEEGRANSCEPSDSSENGYRFLANLGGDARLFRPVSTDGGGPEGDVERMREELREVYSELIERHERLKEQAREAKLEYRESEAVHDEIRSKELAAARDECITNVQSIEELLNEWSERYDEPVTDGGQRRVPESGERATLTVVEETSGETVELSGEVDHASRGESRVYDGEDDESGHMEPGVMGYVETDDGRRLSFNTANDRLTEHYPEAGEAEDSVEFIGVLVEAEFENDGELMTDGGSDQPHSLRENLIENGNKAMEDINRLESSCSDCGGTFPVGQLYWFNRQTFRCSDCHPDIEPVTDGGYTFGGSVPANPERCPDCERLVSRTVNGSRCPYCQRETFGDGGGVEIMADGGHPVREHEEHRTLMGEYNPDEWNPEPDEEYYRSGEVSVHDPIEGEAYSEPGHWADRPADMNAEHARRLALRGEFDDLDEHQPLPLLSSSMRGVPTEGVQGSYSHVIELDEECPECGQQWGVYSCHSTMGGVHSERCLICEAELVGP
jgi:DNA-directed RNA polymerase subunit M/transcription elongation factor TFIIS/Zn finger protein HypA/HybF involved in hydrogenase expression